VPATARHRREQQCPPAAASTSGAEARTSTTPHDPHPVAHLPRQARRHHQRRHRHHDPQDHAHRAAGKQDRRSDHRHRQGRHHVRRRQVRRHPVHIPLRPHALDDQHRQRARRQNTRYHQGPLPVGAGLLRAGTPVGQAGDRTCGGQQDHATGSEQDRAAVDQTTEGRVGDHHRRDTAQPPGNRRPPGKRGDSDCQPARDDDHHRGQPRVVRQQRQLVLTGHLRGVSRPQGPGFGGVHRRHRGRSQSPRDRTQGPRSLLPSTWRHGHDECPRGESSGSGTCRVDRSEVCMRRSPRPPPPGSTSRRPRPPTRALHASLRGLPSRLRECRDAGALSAP